jgi:hypothetical protein
MKFFFVLLNACCDFDEDTKVKSEKRYLVVSERAINFLFLNHVTDMMGGEINMDIAEYFSIYEKLLKSNNYQTLPPRIFDLIRLIEE